MAVGAGDRGTASGTSAARYRRPARQRHGGACHDHPGRTWHSASCRTTGYNCPVRGSPRNSSARCNAGCRLSASARRACHCRNINSCCGNCGNCSGYGNFGSGARQSNARRHRSSCCHRGSDTGNRQHRFAARRACRRTARHGRVQHACGGAAGRHAVQCATGHPDTRAPTGRATGCGHACTGWRNGNRSACRSRQSHAGRRGSAGYCLAACCRSNIHSSHHASCRCNVCAWQRASSACAGLRHGRPGRKRHSVRLPCRGAGCSRSHATTCPVGRPRRDGCGIRARYCPRCRTRRARRCRVASPACQQSDCCRHRRQCPAGATPAGRAR